MAPFGDFIDEHFWLQGKTLKTHVYFRQYQNKESWFPALGVDFTNISFGNKFYTTVAFHGWQQPKDLDFYQSDGEFGGAIDVLFKYRFSVKNAGKLTGISVNLGIVAKTKGFLLEEMALDEHIGLRLGTSIWLK